MLLWIVGAGGLLGSALVRAHPHAPARFVGAPVNWAEPAMASATLDAEVSRFSDVAGDGDWAIVWAAGAGVVGTTRDALDAEADTVRRFAASVRAHRPRGRGAFFLTSSAGMYAGSTHPPFDERTRPSPKNDYGAVKLMQEKLVATEFGDAIPLVVGRISTLYGPGQNLDKAQGLITRLCLQAAMRRPIRVFVPMDTLRDYLYVDDAARHALALIAETVRDQPSAPRTRILAAGQATTVAELVALVQRVSRTRVGVAQGALPATVDHVLDLRIRSRYPLPPGAGVRTLLPVGVQRVFDDIMARAASGSLADRHGLL